MAQSGALQQLDPYYLQQRHRLKPVPRHQRRCHQPRQTNRFRPYPMLRHLPSLEYHQRPENRQRQDAADRRSLRRRVQDPTAWHAGSRNLPTFDLYTTRMQETARGDHDPTALAAVEKTGPEQNRCSALLTQVEGTLRAMEDPVDPGHLNLYHGQRTGPHQSVQLRDLDPNHHRSQWQRG